MDKSPKHSAFLNNVEKELNSKISAQFSKYSNNLRKQMKEIADYKSAFEEDFKEFQSDKIIKDELYEQIKDEEELKELQIEYAAKLKAQKMVKDPKLPELYENEAKKIERQITDRRVQKALKEEAIQNNLQKNLKLNLLPEGMQQMPIENEFQMPESQTVMQDQQQQYLKEFEMDFDKIETELKAQLQSIVNNDYDTFKRIQKNEFSKEDTLKYLKRISQEDLDDMEFERTKVNQYDSSLNNSQYKEFWGEIKPERTTRNSKSVVRKHSDDRKQKGNSNHTRNQNNNSISYSNNNNLLPDIRNRDFLNYSTIDASSAKKVVNNSFITQQPEENQKSQQNEDEDEKKYNLMDEYNKKFSKYDKVRSELKQKDTEQTFKIQIRKLGAKIKNLERSHLINLRYVKEKTKDKAERMINERINRCKMVYETEFQHLCEQFENVKAQLEESERFVRKQSELMGYQETIISQMNNYIETVGYQLRQDDYLKRIKKHDIQYAVDKMDLYMFQDPVSDVVQDVIQQGRELLQHPYGFYTFAIKLNMDNQIEILYKDVIRFYQQKIIQTKEERYLFDIELGELRIVAQNFKRAEERNQQQITELNMKIQLLLEEKSDQKENFERRFNQAAKDFVTDQRKMNKRFDDFKQLTKLEIRTHEEIRVKLQKIIADYRGEIKDLKEALKVPRQYFKFNDQMKYENMVKQKNDILDKLRQEIDNYNPKVDKKKKFVNIADVLNLNKEDQHVQEFIEQAILRKRQSLIGSNNELLNRDFSMFSFQSKATAVGNGSHRPFIQSSGLPSSRNVGNSNHSMIISPSFRFGLMDSHNQINSQKRKISHSGIRSIMKNDESSRFFADDTTYSGTRAQSRNESNYQ
ncbi:UNKNOWN [Stylonychia lemnae]|uniref:Uncharacterized protein n=1 Tax=Stylonychia lemnae TaxID=5949 RepID=A0A078B0B8_STYLE|nr:UNKNOWN [Stylonychia lemnae]|eukprot:CDW87949.1 UNKNOWN [Stylonychia lemnae]